MTSEWTGRHWLTGETTTIRADGGVITEIVPSADPAEAWIAPGLIDVQVNGVGGFDLNRGAPDPENLRGTVRALHRDGITRFCPTVSTGSREHILDSIRAIVDACESDPLSDYSVIGIHVEGPFISEEDGPRGVHDPAWVRPPDWDEFLEWQVAAKGRIRKVTLAPEKPGAIDFIRRLTASGVIAAIGHCAASQEDVAAAAEAGAVMSTHLGNGAHTTIKRHPNYIWAQLADDRMWAGLIGDGFHLPASTLKAMIRAKGKKAILTSDVGYLAQMPPGRYTGHHHSEVVLEDSGLLHLADNVNILAGSASTLRSGVQNVANFGILPLGDAITLASLHPAELFGLADSGVGSLRIGGPADLIRYDWDEKAPSSELVVRTTVSGGETVFSR